MDSAKILVIEETLKKVITELAEERERAHVLGDEIKGLKQKLEACTRQINDSLVSYDDDSDTDMVEVVKPLFTQELSDSLAVFVTEQAAFKEEHTTTVQNHAKLLEKLQARLDKSEAAKASDDSDSEIQDFDADQVDISDLTRPQTKEDAKYSFLGKQIDEANTTIAELKARLNRLENGGISKTADRPFLEGRIDRTDGKVTDLSGRIACVESEIYIIKMQMEAKQIAAGKPNSYGNGKFGSDVYGDPVSQDVQSAGWSVKETFVPRAAAQSFTPGAPSATGIPDDGEGEPISEVVVLQQTLEERQRMATIIDDANDHGMLLGIFRELSEMMKDGYYFGYRKEGLFGGTHDEVTTLRNRVVRRLATLNDCKDAFQEAKKRTDVKK